MCNYVHKTRVLQDINKRNLIIEKRLNNTDL